MSSAAPRPPRNRARTARRGAAGGFGLLTVIAELLGLYGVVLVVIGIADGSDQLPAGEAGVSTSLWAGIAMLVGALLVAAWSLWRSRAAAGPADDDRAH